MANHGKKQAALGRLKKADLIEEVERLERENEALRQRLEGAETEVVNSDIHSERKRLLDATEIFTDGFALYGPDDRLVVCNETFRNAMDDVADIMVPGLKFEDFHRIRAERKTRDDNEVRDEAWIQERLEQHRNPTGPIERRFEDGRLVRIQEFKTEDGSTVIIRTDLTDQHHAIGTANLIEHSFRTLIDNANRGIFVHRHYRPLYANQALLDIYGYDGLEKFLELVSTKELTDSTTLIGAHEKILSGKGVPLDVEVEGVRVDGSKFWEHRHSFAIDWDGEPAVCSMRSDISDRKEAEGSLRRAHDDREIKIEERTRELSESEGRLRQLVDALEDAFALFDPDDRLVMWNEKWLDRHRTGKDIIKVGLKFEDLTRALVARREYADAVGREEE